jgi:predicted molibdopterin-dependent oxidoreductase YjgC
LAAKKAGIETSEIDAARQIITDTQGDLIVMFGGELSREAQAVVGQLASVLGADHRRVLLHPLPLFNNSIGAHDMLMMNGAMTASEMVAASGDAIRAMYVAGSFLPQHLENREDALAKLDFLVVQELFETETTKHADVVLPASSYAEQDGTFTNNDGLVQRVRQSIPPLHQSKPDWMIVAQIAKELGLDYGFEVSPSAVFREIGEHIPAYSGMRYPLLKDETNPIQAKHHVAEADVSEALAAVRNAVETLDETGEKIYGTPKVGHELFRIGNLTDKVSQFHLLASGNPRPETTAISPLYQIARK